jgi:GMP reductase
MRIEQAVKLDYDNVLLQPKRSRLLSRSEVTLSRTFKFPHSPLVWEGVPIVAANMSTIGTFPVARVLSEYQMLTCIHKHYSLTEWIEPLQFGSVLRGSLMISLGINQADFDKFKKITKMFHGTVGPCFVCLDVANGYSEAFAGAVEKLRTEYPDWIIVAGNVATPEMTEELILRGADIVKFGIGPGSACTTRKVTGVGYPQLSAVIECSDAAHGLDGHIMADGGCTTSGDVAKAFCGGADFVMLGGMLAGHDETGTEFYGMSSYKAQMENGGELKDYRASEGRELTIEARGSLKGTIREILGGVRSACTYIGARELKHAPKCATFVRTERQYNTMYGS